jgi:hypothetical protein
MGDLPDKAVEAMAAALWDVTVPGAAVPNTRTRYREESSQALDKALATGYVQAFTREELLALRFPRRISEARVTAWARLDAALKAMGGEE